jgi:hypothetical protein
MESKSDDIVIYLPVHSNYSQIEHTAAFLTKYKAKLVIRLHIYTFSQSVHIPMEYSWPQDQIHVHQRIQVQLITILSNL